MLRVRLYHWTIPNGVIFESDEEVVKALGKGWVTAPWLAVKPELEGIPTPLCSHAAQELESSEVEEKKDLKAKRGIRKRKSEVQSGD